MCLGLDEFTVVIVYKEFFFHYRQALGGGRRKFRLKAAREVNELTDSGN